MKIGFIENLYIWDGMDIQNRYFEKMKIYAGDEKGKKNLDQHIVKTPISHERMIYDKEQQIVLYRAKKERVTYDPLDWLFASTSHIPNKGAQNVHYYGAYSNKSRGMQKKIKTDGKR